MLRILETGFTKKQKKDILRAKKEHGGKLWKKPVLEELIQEHLDEGVYLYTLLMKINEVQMELENILEDIEFIPPGEEEEALPEIYNRIEDLIAEMEDL